MAKQLNLCLKIVARYLDLTSSSRRKNVLKKDTSFSITNDSKKNLVIVNSRPFSFLVTLWR